MAHVYQQVVDAAADLLSTVPALAGRVYRYRALPAQQAQLPLATVDVTQVRTDPATLHRPRAQTHDVTLVVNVGTSGQTERAAREALHALVASVSRTLLGDLTLSGTAHDVRLVLETYGQSTDGERPVAEAALEFSVVTRTRESDPETVLGL